MSKIRIAGIFAFVSLFLPQSGLSAGPAANAKGPAATAKGPAVAAAENPSAVTFPGLTRYVDLKAFYSVLMRGTPEKKEQFELKGAKYSSVLNEDKQGVWAVAFADIQDMGNPPYDQKKASAVVNEQSKAYVEKIQGKMQVYLDYLKFGYQFREVKGRIDSGPRQGGRFRINCYLAGKRMFIVAVEGKEDWVKSPQSNAFLSSFEVPGASAPPKLNVK